MEENEEKNPRRMYDPKAWSCLSDEQREIINKWFREHDEKMAKIHRKECDDVESEDFNAGTYALIPFAVAYAFNLHQGTLGSIFNAICAMIVYALIFYIFSYAYKRNNNKDNPKWNAFVKISGAIFVTLCVLYKINGY